MPLIDPFEASWLAEEAEKAEEAKERSSPPWPDGHGNAVPPTAVPPPVPHAVPPSYAAANGGEGGYVVETWMVEQPGEAKKLSLPPPNLAPPLIPSYVVPPRRPDVVAPSWPAPGDDGSGDEKERVEVQLDQFPCRKDLERMAWEQ